MAVLKNETMSIEDAFRLLLEAIGRAEARISAGTPEHRCLRAALIEHLMRLTDWADVYIHRPNSEEGLPPSMLEAVRVLSAEVLDQAIKYNDGENLGSIGAREALCAYLAEVAYAIRHWYDMLLYSAGIRFPDDDPPSWMK